MYKYKLKEIEVGKKDISNGVQTTVKFIDPETKTTEWDVKYNVDLGAVIKNLNDAIESLKAISRHNREDTFLRDIVESIKSVKNEYRAHIRSEYPIEYEDIKRKKTYMREDVEEIDEESTSGDAGSYNTPFAFNKNKNAKGAPSIKYYYKLGFKPVKNKVKGSGLEVKKLWEEDDKI